MASSRILVVDDEPDIRELIGEILGDEGFDVRLAGDGSQAREARSQMDPDLILLDVWMPDIDGISLLKEWGEAGGLNCPVVMISGHGSVSAAVEATRLGAFDFVEKPISLAKLMATINQALEAGRGAGSARAAPAPQVHDPIGRSRAMQEMRERMERIASCDATVLITGEAGTGKETVARWIHAHSARAEAPFRVAGTGYDAAGLRTLLVGNGDRGGLLAEAAGGVIYLDDLSRLDSGARDVLLHVIGSGRIDPDNPASPAVDVRWISGTTRAIDRLARAGQFDEKLYLQLAELPLEVPPLRERAEDIPELVRFYAEYLPGREGLPYRQFPVAVQNRLRQHKWPGNLRELRNLIQRLLVLGGDDEVSTDEVEPVLEESALELQPVGDPAPPLFDMPLREAREEFERQYLIYKLKRVNGSVGQLAEVVEMERTHLYRKLRQLGVDPKQVARENNGPK